MSSDATAHARFDASDIPVETPPKAPPGTRRPRKPPRVIPSPPPPTPQKEYSRRGTNATVQRFTFVDCGFVTSLSKGATEDPAMCPHVETDTRGSSKTLVRHTCKACLKVLLELPRNGATVQESTAKDVSRADTSQFRDISRAMHVRPQMTLNAREVDLVLGLLTRGAHVHLSRFSSISGTDFVSLLDDAIESILDPTETFWSDIIIVSESIRNSDPIKSLCCVLPEQHGAPECFRTTAATVAGSTNACHGCGCGWKRDWSTV